MGKDAKDNFSLSSNEYSLLLYINFVLLISGLPLTT